MGIAFAVLNAVLLALANIFLKKSFKDFAPSVSFFIFSLFALLLWIPTGLFLEVSFDNWLFGLLIGTTSAIFGQAIYIYVLGKGELSITATILSSFSIYTILFSVLFNGESLSGLTFSLVGLTILGTLIVSFPERGQFDRRDLTKITPILWAVAAAILIGASDTIAKFYMNNHSLGSFLFYTAIAQVFVSTLYFKWDGQKFNQFSSIFSKLEDYKFALLGSMTIASSTMCLFLAFYYTLASIASPISASYPVLTVIMALLFLKEKLTIKNAVGVILVLISILGIGFVVS